jgi:hypothetical protein
MSYLLCRCADLDCDGVITPSEASNLFHQLYHHLYRHLYRHLVFICITNCTTNFSLLLMPRLPQVC